MHSRFSKIKLFRFKKFPSKYCLFLVFTLAVKFRLKLFNSFPSSKPNNLQLAKKEGWKRSVIESRGQCFCSSNKMKFNYKLWYIFCAFVPQFPIYTLKFPRARQISATINSIANCAGGNYFIRPRVFPCLFRCFSTYKRVNNHLI